MKIVRYLATIISLILLVSGCSNKTTRMMVSQVGSDEILVIDLDPTTPVINSFIVPVASPLLPYNSLKVDIHPWGTMGYATKIGATSHKLNLDTGQVIPSPNNPIEGKNLLVSAPTGVFIVTANTFRGLISAYSALNSKFLSSLVLEGRGIADIAVCDDNKTILVTNRGGAVATPEFFVSRLAITSAGQLSNPGQELTSVDYIQQVACASSSNTGAVLVAGATNKVISFTINATTGLTQADVENTIVNGPFGKNPNIPNRPTISQALIFNPDGNELFVRLSTIGTSNPQGWIEKFAFNNNTGVMTASVSWVATAPHTGRSHEGARISMHPDGDFIYVPHTSAGKISVINTANGSQANAITDTRITAPSYISVGKVKCLDLNNTGCP